MAWEVLTTVLKELNFEYNGNVQKIAPVDPAFLVYNNDGVTMCASPYSSSIISHSANAGTADYAAIVAQTSGSLDLCVLGSVMSNNGTAYIYRDNRNVRLEITRQDQLTGNIRYILYGYVYGSRTEFLRVEERDHRTYYNNKIGLIFLKDDSNKKYQLWSQLTFTIPNNRAFLYLSCSGTGDSLVKNVVLDNLITGNEYTPPTPSRDPYAEGGYSTGTDTGTGTFDDTSESVSLPTTYAMSATASGLMSQYVLSEANLAAFANWLWNGGSIIDDLKHFFASPMEAIFSVGMLPFTPSDTTNYNIYVGSLDAGVTGGLVGDTVEKIDCGTIDFDGYYGSALDFNPYTKIEIFLPYCGNFALNPDEVMGHTIGVKYYCDTVSGDCVAFIYDEERVLYQVKGNCFVQIPLAARDFTAQYASAIGTVGTVAAGLAASVASGGMTAPVAVGMGTSMAANAMNAKAHVARAGGVSGMAGFMSIQTPYVIITVPNQCLPELQADHQGYPLFVTKRLGDFRGFTKVYEIHLDGLDCTDAEAKEIYDLLKGGVIL